ncbi:hypothetical protein ACWDSJ_09100 [Nocardia sp. NPDC003482]
METLHKPLADFVAYCYLAANVLYVVVQLNKTKLNMVHHESLDTHADRQPHVEAENVAEEQHRFHYFRAPGVGAKVLEAIAQPSGADKKISDVLDWRRQRILERFTSDIEGLNIERVDNFFDELGLRRAPLVVIDKSRKAELRRFLEKVEGPVPVLDDEHDHRGWYRNDLDIAFVFRNREFEEFNGPEYTEGIIVHELAHSSGRRPDTRVVVEGEDDEQALGVTFVRSGQTVHSYSADINEDEGVPDATGTFLEEAFAEQIRAKYLTDELGFTGGLAKLEKETVTGRVEETGFDFSVPSKYFQYESSDGNPVLSASSYPGAAMDALITKDPELFPALIEARRSAYGLREVARRINGIHSGLYKTLRDEFNHSGDFANGYFYVLEALASDDARDAEPS